MFNSLSGFEVLLILVICIFVFTTSLINVINVENEDDDQSKVVLIVISYLVMLFFGGAMLLFAFAGLMKFKNNSNIFNSSSTDLPLKKIFGFDSGASAFLFFSDTSDRFNLQCNNVKLYVRS